MVEFPREGPRETPHGPGTNRVAATLCIWGIAAALAGLVWLGTQESFIGIDRQL
jgi:hypothetical protein